MEVMTPVSDKDPLEDSPVAMPVGLPDDDYEPAEPEEDGMYIIAIILQSLLLFYADKTRDPQDKIWSIYVLETAQTDRALAERWIGDMEGLLIFVSSLPFAGDHNN
jgi:hypothetical protein